MPRDNLPAVIAVPLFIVLCVRLVWPHRAWWATYLGLKEEQ